MFDDLNIKKLMSEIEFYNGKEKIIDYLLNNNCIILAEKIALLENEKKRVEGLKLINKLFYKRRMDACRELYEDLDSKNIKYAVIKGDVLSLQIYGNIGYRKSIDVDLLIKHKDVDNIKNVLYKNSFFQDLSPEISKENRRKNIFWSCFTHQIRPFIKNDNYKTIVDINFDIYWGHKSNQEILNKVLENIETTEIDNLNINTLNLEMSFIVMCIHHYKDLNSIYLISQGSYKLCKFIDIICFIKANYNKFDLKKLKKCIEGLKAEKYIAWCIQQAMEIFPDPVCAQFLENLKINKVSIEFYGLEKNIYKWKFDLFYRLFGENFQQEFTDSLDEIERHKIKTNLSYV